MSIYAAFGLISAPFESRPDPHCFFGASSHAETLATLQFAVRTGKACTLVLGDSGAGKTLIGQLLAEHASRSNHVVWVHGLVQPDTDAPLLVYPPGTFVSRPDPAAPRPTTGTFSNWVRTAHPAAAPTVVVIDHADALPRTHWTDLLTLLTRDARATRPISFIILGVPAVIELLASPRLARLRRRIFRTCQLNRLSRDDTEAYILHRLRIAGSEVSPFTMAAVDAIHRYSRGNPGRINQICDSALIDAFGDDRKTIDAEHILIAVRAITGPPRRQRLLPTTTVHRLGPQARPLLPETVIDLPTERRVIVERLELACAADPTPEPRPHQVPCTDQPPHDATTVTTETEPVAATVAPADFVLPEEDPATPASELLFDRLRDIEARVSNALSRVRHTRVHIEDTHT